MKLSSFQNKFLLGIIAALVILRVLIIADIPFTDTTESRYAEIARKMVETNDWITPQFDYGVPFWGKPPLHTWLSALGMKCFGINEFGARIFIFLAACFLVILLYQWVRRIKGHDYALVGTVTLVSSGLFYLASATVMTDLSMAFGTSLSMIAFWNALDPKQHPRQKLWGYLFFVGLAIGLLAKGPVSTVLCAIPIGLWVLMTNQWVRTWKCIPWFTGSLLALCITAPWYIAAELKTPGFIDYFIVGEHFQRFTQSGWDGDLYGNGHAHPKGTIWLYALLCLLPWTPFILTPLFRFKKILSELKHRKNTWLLYLICWALSPMLFFTLSTNILATYVLTGIPACCFLAIELWTVTRSSENASYPVKFYTGTAVFSLLLFLSAYIAYQVNPEQLSKKSQIFLVEKTKQLRQSPDGELYYWKKRFYSADFYTGGKAKRVDDETQLMEVIQNDQRDFLAIENKTKVIQRIPAELLSSFTSVGTFGKMVLYYENTVGFE